MEQASSSALSLLRGSASRVASSFWQSQGRSYLRQTRSGNCAGLCIGTPTDWFVTEKLENYYCRSANRSLAAAFEIRLNGCKGSIFAVHALDPVGHEQWFTKGYLL
jgi:hypothetical protein